MDESTVNKSRTISHGPEVVERLVSVVQELSLARELKTIMEIVRHAARELTGADGATFILREGGFCYYADEDAISPLWKGKRFPMEHCISGWAMLNRQAARIEDIFSDPRIPVEAYRPTFVKSLAMVPIRTADPIGAIGNYWATRHEPTDREVKILQALADITSVAMENVRVYSELEQRVLERTAELEAATNEMESFSYAVSHDLRAPLRAIRGFSESLLEECGQALDRDCLDYLNRIQRASDRMNHLIEGLLSLARLSRQSIQIESVDLSQLAREIASELQAGAPTRRAAFNIAKGLKAEGDSALLRAALENLLSNAWKFSATQMEAKIEFGIERNAVGSVYFVRDNGVGFDMTMTEKLFTPFQRMHTEKEFAGSGIGLATVQRIIQRHGGQIWAEAAVDQGATFYFTLGLINR